jgi:hypothetical protein
VSTQQALLIAALRDVAIIVAVVVYCIVQL